MCLSATSLLINHQVTDVIWSSHWPAMQKIGMAEHRAEAADGSCKVYNGEVATYRSVLEQQKLRFFFCRGVRVDVEGRRRRQYEEGQ